MNRDIHHHHAVAITPKTIAGITPHTIASVVPRTFITPGTDTNIPVRSAPLPNVDIPFSEPPPFGGLTLVKNSSTDYSLDLGNIVLGEPFTSDAFLRIDDRLSNIFAPHNPATQRIEQTGEVSQFTTVLNTTAVEFGDNPANLWLSVVPETNTLGSHSEIVWFESEPAGGSGFRMAENLPIFIHVTDNIVKSL